MVPDAEPQRHRHFQEASRPLRLRRLTGAFLAGYRNANTRTADLQQTLTDVSATPVSADSE